MNTILKNSPVLPQGSSLPEPLDSNFGVNRTYEAHLSSQPTNGFAIAGFVTSLIACWPVGLILSAVALSQFKRNSNQKGRGLAIAGLVIGLITTAFLVLTFIVVAVASKS